MEIWVVHGDLVHLKLIGKYKNAIRMKVSVIAPPATVYKKRD
jgi:hypothetical protein